MSTIKKGILTTSGQWAKHLRKSLRSGAPGSGWKRIFWHGERRAAKHDIRKQLELKDEQNSRNFVES
jgi:hypothetical protein